ncbi:MAG: SDR family NAD(P)-dependent oxidoreductase [Candidatus Eisenbacteria bacterium]|nr:SDR family NAD(P)-dependent oxidoreductase [Candidatus Eisenbacteria bacterium]
MERKTILILGGYGAAGSACARRLLKQTDARVVLGGRHREKAEAFAAQLGAGDPERRVSAVQVDANDPTSLAAALAGVRILLDCGPTLAFTEALPRAAIAAGADLVDVHPARSLHVLRGMERDIVGNGRCFVTQAGLHPGLPSTLIRFAAGHFARCDTVVAGMLFRIKATPRADSVVELVEMITEYKMLIWKDGAWQRAPSTHTRKFDFGPDLGTRTCYPLWDEDLEPVPRMCALREAGFYAAGFNWFVDWVVFPAALVLGAMRKGLGVRPLAHLMAWGVRTFTRPPHAIVIALTATGESEGRPRTVQVRVRSDDDDGYQLTAIPTVACIRQMLDGTVAKPGLHLMGHVVDPVRLLRDMETMGVQVSVEVKP